MEPKQKILIAGGTGLVGQRLIQLLPQDRFEINILTRSPRPPYNNVTYYQWDIQEETIDKKAVNVDHIINLTGAGIADKRWSTKRKNELIDSRVKSIRLLSKGLKKINHRPQTIISASAIGYYGNRYDELLSTSSSPGIGFLAECCKQWESAAMELESQSERLNILRIGIVLSYLGGALPKILMTRRIGILNYFGSGEQYYSWIHIDDLCSLIIEILGNKQYAGIYNAVSPNPLTNKQFVKGISEGLNSKFLIIPVPKSGLRLAMGEMADIVLNSNRVIPLRIQKEGFKFTYVDLPQAIQHLIETKI